MTWAQIRKLYLSACGGATAADQEWPVHLTQGYRRVASELDVPELHQPEASADVKEDPANPGTYLDYVEMDCGVYQIDSVVNLTKGIIMYPEPKGIVGRNQYIVETTGTYGMPPKGDVTHYLRRGNRLLVRDRPRDGEPVKLAVHFKIQVPDVTADDLNSHPLTPSQYDMAIVHRAAESFFLMHKEANKPSGAGEPPPSVLHYEAANNALVRSQDPKVEEDRPRNETIRVAGYRLRPRWR